MIELPKLRDYQIENVQAVQAALIEHRKIIDCMPTGAGKSTVAKYIMGSKLNRPVSPIQSGKAVFAVHRRGLVDNAIETFMREPAIPHGVIMSGRKPSGGHRMQIASIDTLLAWYVDGSYVTGYTFDLCCFDEIHAHHSKFQKFIEAHDRKRAELGLHPAYVIGLSATPMAKGLANLYKKIVKGPSVQWLINNDHLVPMRYFQAKRLGRLDRLKASGEGYTAESLKEAFDGLAGDLVRDWAEVGRGRPTVGFFSRVSHSMEACAELNAHGISAKHVDGSTPDDERQRLFRGLNDGEFQYLCNVGIVDRGTDIPNIGCVQLATSVNSVPRLIQMLGRGSRISSMHADCVVIDHGGSIARLNTFFEDEIEWLLEADKAKDLKSEAKPVITCPRCRVQYRGGKCRACGYEPTSKERKAVGLEFVDGKLVELTKKVSTKKQTNEQIWTQALYMAGKSGRTYKQAIGIARSKAERQGTKFRVPSAIDIAGRSLRAIPFGHPDGSRKVALLYDGFFS
jgi:DNA repair protein RadD